MAEWNLTFSGDSKEISLNDFGLFFASMEMFFRNISFRMSEQQKLAIVMRNMLPMYADGLALEDIRSLPQLASMCKKIEEVRYRINRQGFPQINRRDLLEPAFSYSSPHQHRQRVAEVELYSNDETEYAQVAQIAHRGQYTSERNLFCYKCGLSGYVTRTCVRCNGQNQGNANTSFTQGTRMNSNQYQAPERH